MVIRGQCIHLCRHHSQLSYIQGPAHLATIHDQLRTWMSEHDYDSVDEMRGAVSRASVADPTAYERANYIGNLASYTSRFLGDGSVPLRRP